MTGQRAKGRYGGGKGTMRRSPAAKPALLTLHLPRPVGSSVIFSPAQKQRGCCQTTTCRPTIQLSMPTRISPCAIGSMQPRHLERPVLAASTTTHSAFLISVPTGARRSVCSEILHVCSLADRLSLLTDDDPTSGAVRAPHGVARQADHA